MVVMILENAPAALRGELTRWLIEPHPGVFVGHVSARVRDYLWQRCLTDLRGGHMIQLWSTNNEQHFDVRCWRNSDREMVWSEGIWLVRRRPEAQNGGDSESGLCDE
ncbi:MAG: type I-E CRISPR-associated endoribonuclease Cas2e [Anaerolineae bacterium]